METAGVILGMAGLVIVGATIVWLIDRFSRDRIMRCPETGAVTIVRVVEREGVPVVQRCESWLQVRNCKQGCLARYAETGPGVRVNVDALRPFERS
jgi:hypothetical protein